MKGTSTSRVREPIIGSDPLCEGQALESVQISSASASAEDASRLRLARRARLNLKPAAPRHNMPRRSARQQWQSYEEDSDVSGGTIHSDEEYPDDSDDSVGAKIKRNDSNKRARLPESATGEIAVETPGIAEGDAPLEIEAIKLKRVRRGTPLTVSGLMDEGKGLAQLRRRMTTKFKHGGKNRELNDTLRLLQQYREWSSNDLGLSESWPNVVDRLQKIKKAEINHLLQKMRSGDFDKEREQQTSWDSGGAPRPSPPQPTVPAAPTPAAPQSQTIISEDAKARMQRNLQLALEKRRQLLAMAAMDSQSPTQVLERPAAVAEPFPKPLAFEESTSQTPSSEAQEATSPAKEADESEAPVRDEPKADADVSFAESARPESDVEPAQREDGDRGAEAEEAELQD